MMFSYLPEKAQYAVLAAFFFVAIAQFILLITKFLASKKIKNYIFDVILFLALLVSLSYFYTEFQYSELNIPLIYLVLFMLISVTYTVFGMFTERKKSKNRITPWSVKQALDDMHTGICFADTSGRIILINKQMLNLISLLSLAYPQTVDDLISTVKEHCKENGENLYCFPDNTFWRITLDEIMQDGKTEFIQLNASDVTDIYRVNREIEQENEALRKTNEELQIMFDKLSYYIREQETLNLKMQIHDSIGTSLIAVNDLIDGSSQDDISENLNNLQRAVSYFSGNAAFPYSDMQDVISLAKSINISVETDGVIPENKKVNPLIALALRECITNCKNHAKGDTVYIKIYEKEKVYNVVISNNGKKPEGEITEGGGLSNLRRKIEGEGGNMKIVSRPEFSLMLELKKE